MAGGNNNHVLIIKSMKKSSLYLLTILLNIGNVYCQLNPCKEKINGFNLKMDNLHYSHTINCALDSLKLLENIKVNMEQNQMFSQVVQNGSKIRCIVMGHTINYSKFGGKKLGLWLGVTVPISYSLSIDVKNNKYKITLMNIKSTQPEIYVLNRQISPEIEYDFNTDIFNNNGCLKSLDFYTKSLSIFSTCMDDFYSFLCDGDGEESF